MENKNKANSQAGNAKDRKRANGANSNVNFNGSAKNVRKMKQLGMRCKQLLQCASGVDPNDSISTLWNTYTTIHTMLIDIVNLEKDWNKVLPERNAETMNELTEWVKNKGGILNGVSISHFDDYDYGLKADLEIEKDDVIILIPRNIMMSLEDIVKSPLRVLFGEDPMLKEMPNIALAIFLMIERFKPSEPSKWLPYIKALPNTYTTPFYYDLNDFAELRGTAAFEPAVRLCINIARQYAYFKNVLAKKPNDAAAKILKTSFTYDQYRWAVSTVMTRQNSVFTSKSDKTLTFVPLWDYCNHAEREDGSDIPNTSYEVAVDYSICQAFRHFKAGEQVFIYYGNRSNTDFLLHNGFVYPDHKTDRMMVKFGLSNSDVNFDKRAALLDKLEIAHHGDFLIYDNLNEPFDADLLAFVRVFKLPPEELDCWMNRSAGICNPLFRCKLFYLKKTHEDLDTTTGENDIQRFARLDDQVLTYLKNRMAILIRAFPTSVENDQELLATEELSRLRKMIIMYRLREKQILTKVFEACLLLEANPVAAPSTSIGDSADIKDVNTPD